MIEERQYIEAGVTEAIETLRDGLHSEDDHGYDLYKWLSGRKEEMINAVCERIVMFRRMVVD